jgi:hypothetical protein
VLMHAHYMLRQIKSLGETIATSFTRELALALVHTTFVPAERAFLAKLPTADVTRIKRLCRSRRWSRVRRSRKLVGIFGGRRCSGSRAGS